MTGDLSQFRELDSIKLISTLVRKWWQLEVAFADEKGYVTDHAQGKIVPSGNHFCRLALFSKDGFKRCNESVKLVRDRLRSNSDRSQFVHQCHLGFDVVASPIRFDGKLVGFIFTGGSYTSEPSANDRNELFRKAKELSPQDAKEIEQGFAGVPRLSERERRLLADLIEYGAQEVMAHYAEKIAPRLRTKVPENGRTRFRELVGESASMHEIFDLLDKVVRSESTVLVHGESGTGKELIARAIHDYGPRAKKPFVVQNCSAFNDNLLESALFGHLRGAFTGAVKDTKGLFELADGGTFFLDEIGDMSPALQVKLLRVLQEGTFTPVGATKQVKVDVRIIAASHKDLGKMVEKGEFREDLYYRVNVLKVVAPPLRERLDDLPLLVSHFVKKHGAKSGVTPLVTEAALEVMRGYNWPGNIRELENEIERLMVLSAGGDELPASLLSPRIREAAPAQSAAPRPTAGFDFESGKFGSLKEMVESVESEVIAQGLIRTHWNKSQLAKELGISRSNLIQKCSYYGLERKR